jgi:molybdate transport system substrate-binding protein
MTANIINGRMRNAALFIVFMLLAAGCAEKQETGETNKKEITVFAAASLTGAFGGIKEAYEKDNPGVSIVYNFDGTQALRTHLEQGAYADVFASANTKHMDALKNGGLIRNDTVSTFAKNRIVIIVPKDNRRNISNLSDLAEPKTRIVIGTKDVPCGAYALQILDKLANDSRYGLDYRRKVMDNVLSQETAVTGIVAKVSSGEADAGFTYYSDVSEDAKDKLTKIDIPDGYNVVAEYPIAVTEESGEPEEAIRFIGYVESDKGRAILEEYGFALI